MKMPDFAMNSVFAKVRALYGKRLTVKNYNEMLNLTSINEIAEYLKTKTAYSEIFEGISNTEEFQRSRLENLLFNKMYNEMISVIRFQKAAGNELYEYFIMKYDTQQIIKVLSSLETKSDSYFFTFPAFYNERSKLDLYKMALSKTDDEILECTKNTIYYPTLRDALPKYRLSSTLSVVQADFNFFLDNQFIRLMSSKKKDTLPEKSETVDIYKRINDLSLVKALYRIKRFSLSEGVNTNINPPVVTLFTPKQLDEMIKSETSEQLCEVLSKTYLASLAAKIEDSDIYYATERMLFKMLSDAVSRSNDPQAVMFAYFNFAQAEIRNIIHIIEGIRYGLSPDEIRPMLSCQDIS